MFKICAVVSSYFPDLNELEKNINSYLHWVDRLIIWENTPRKESKIATLIDALNSDKIEFRTTGQNEYLAKPFNICIQWAKENGYTHLLTMDQDSCFENGHFEKYINKIIQVNNDSIAVYAPNTQNLEIESEILEKDVVITSGAIIPLKVFNIIGTFNEDFLIDRVDTEFCFRTRIRGFKVVCITQVILNHKLGYQKRNGLGLVINNYSAQRTYYIIRNSILLWKLYPDMVEFNEKYAFYKFKVVFRLAKIIFEKDRFRKLEAIFLGLMHGYLSKKGRYDL
ncbi:MAG TPA: hypothetical protein DER09_02065 [Prolixibacteraceae bacterium]|nr:hypothetical protein [Prolixibacteraceae bacterium]